MTVGTTRELIAAEARRQFMAQGYAATSVRGVAGAAGIDPALVIRHFGSKEQLFLATVDVEGPFAPALAGPLTGMGERLVALVLDERLSGVLRTPYRAMIRATDSAAVREQLVAAMEATLARPLAERLDGPDAELRAHLVAAQVGGLLEALVILEDPAVVDADAAAVARLYGAAVSTLLTPPSG
ncbi:TetR/AcrR family transcriptional regulator [Nocardioides lianchengensis]|uniref:DNA-binding transcriptional regulator, AcrR family n=1 Tax=Nocardioides lianchengensis TaxID=1045774 RepID=A0A1G6SFU2_9ACTN|nr:TetR/AcrR family transcriptional regulator [Nocardioides lianchengensis]NYG09807.1 AcrR family transcriptional regulator [Nocardioides lianchengensis]SDD15046.1 DNA-binding transcriptional regulator, AcrR family [Nocardioides lianchengensis]